MYKRSFCLLIIFVLFSQLTMAQTPPTANSADIYLQLKKLKVLGSVLYIAAHPDDENNGLLPFFAKEKLYRTGYLSLTRGDGGQNLIGSEQGIELGLIRTQELLAARRVDGAEQFFSRAYEFGFSKSADEALRIWDHEKILSDVVWVIRQYQPDVIIKRFPPDARAGHGHHAASAIIADEAFVAAADPKRFPEQLAYGVKPWQAKRIMWNTFNFGGNNTTSDDQLKIEVGGYNALIGKSYGELGGEARSMHKSQGEGRPRRRGQIYEYFATSAGEAPKTDLMDGIVADWKRIPGGERIQAMVDGIITNFSFDKPQLSVPALVNVYRAIKALPESTWRNKKLDETQSLIVACSALFAEAVTQEETAVQGDTLRVSFNLNTRSEVPVMVRKLALVSSQSLAQQKLTGAKKEESSMLFFANSPNNALLDSMVAISLSNNKNVTVDKAFKIDDDAPLSQPYWLENGIKQGYFDVTNPLLIGDAESKPNYIARFTFQIEGLEFTEDRPVQYKYVDAVKGELYEPLTILPKVTVFVSPTIILNNVVPAVNPSVRVVYTSNIDAANVPVTLTLQNGSATTVVKDVPTDFRKGVSGSIDVNVKDIYHKGQRNYIQPVLSLKLNGKEESFSQNLMTIKYDHIPFINYFSRDNLKVIDAEIKVVGKKIGYIVGAGDKVPDALTAMGYEVNYLAEANLTLENLKQFDAVIVGVRAHNIHEYLSNKTDVLNRYVENGGNLIVQYMKSNQVGLKRIKVGPYPFSVTGTRVTEENANVTMLLPKHSVFNYPNTITSADFEGWVQERSTYQAEQADERYERLIGMKDTNDKENGQGSLLVAKYGKGNFAYVSLVLFRQLPAGVPGAYRLMANLIALPKNKVSAK
jgi:LmbE family N-acetylglucosaminyl deacetylase